MISFYPDKTQEKEDFFDNLIKFNIRQIPLRIVDENLLLNVSLDRHKEYKELLDSNKIKVSYLDFDKQYFMFDEVDLDELFDIANIYQTRKILIPFFKINDFNNQKDEVVNFINNLLTQSRKKRIELVFKINYEIESSSIAYLVKKIKNILFHFNPGECYLNKRSITSYYRLLKNNLSVVSLYDVNEHEQPVLLGYGKGQILDTIDKLLRDRFKGHIIYDYNLKEYIQTREKAYKRFFKNPFRSKKRKAHLKMDQALNLSSDDSISIIEVINSQLTFIRRYKRL